MNVAVIGTGTLGPAIAQVFSQCDKIEKVYLCKGRETSKSTGRESVQKIFDKHVKKQKLSETQVEYMMEKIECGEIALAASAHLIIEAVSENLEIKRDIFRRLDSICDTNSIFATNTSSLSITDIGKGLNRPLIGMHFFNPVSVMNLIEVVVSKTTPIGIVDEIMEISRWLDKTPVRVHESPGFVVNRVLIPMINEAIGIYAEGVASVADIDTAMKLGANHPMGPLALGDLIGLDVVLAILNTLLKETGDTRYLPQPMLRKMVWENKLGRKTGEGFYKY